MPSTRALQAIFAGPVALEERAFDRLSSVVIPGLHTDVARMVLAAVSGRDSAKPSVTYSKNDGVATIGIFGVIVANEDDDNDYFGLISCERIRSDIAAAMDDDDISEIALKICSPGGSVLGLEETAGAIRAAGVSKRVTAFSDGMMCSAAYYLGSQASEVCVSKDSINGSIGVFSTAYDTSRLYENMGVKVQVIKAGAMKGAGTPGTPLTEAQMSEKQKIVDAYYGMFVDAVAAGRKIPREKALALADGAVHVGQASVNNALADSTDNFDAVHTRMSARTKTKSPQARGLHNNKGVKAMTAEEEKKTQDDTLAKERKRTADITAAFADDPAYANKCIGEGKSLLEAKAEYSDVLKAKLKTSSDENVALKSVQGTTGNATIPSGTNGKKVERESGLSAKDEFSEKVKAHTDKGVSKGQAVQRVVKANPELHRAMLEESNPKADTELVGYFSGSNK